MTPSATVLANYFCRLAFWFRECRDRLKFTSLRETQAVVGIAGSGAALREPRCTVRPNRGDQLTVCSATTSESTVSRYFVSSSSSIKKIFPSRRWKRIE
jgi:hypothetical protein